MRTGIILLSFLFLSFSVSASQEGILELSRFQIASDGIGESGSVLISGERDKEGHFLSLLINAFEQEYHISPESLDKIPLGLYNGVQISYERGYERTGGRTLYIQLQSGFTSGIKDRVVLVLTEKGDFKVTLRPSR